MGAGVYGGCVMSVWRVCVWGCVSRRDAHPPPDKETPTSPKPRGRHPPPPPDREADIPTSPGPRGGHPTPTSEQKESQTLVKILPCPKVRLWTEMKHVRLTSRRLASYLNVFFCSHILSHRTFVRQTELLSV